MRPIKFRAWDRENKKMCDLESIHFGHAGAPTLTAWITTPQGYQRLLVFGENADLIQFTGLKDRTGREIYEGDIVRCWKKHSHIDEARDELVEGYATAVIKANGWTFFFEVIKQDDPRGWFFYGPEADEFYGVCTDYETMEVIGNIYENPELLGPAARENGGK